MCIYTHFEHFLLLRTHIFHVFSILNLSNLLDNLVLKYAQGLEKPKNDDKSEISMVRPTYSLYTHFLTHFKVGHTHFGILGLASLVLRLILIKIFL